MAPYSLRSRVLLVQQKFGVKISRWLLHDLYWRHGIRFLKPQYSYNRKLAQKSDINEEQQRVSIEIAQLMSANKHIIYIDESSFHQWLVPSRAWVSKDMVLKMPSSRGKSMTIIAGISEKLGIAHFKIVRGSNDASSFKAFINELVRNTKGEAFVYMDNYSVHHSREVREYFNERI